MNKSAGKHCRAPGCTNFYYKTTNKHYHRLPIGDSVRMKQWLHNLKRKNAPKFVSSRVCSDHFIEDDYLKTGSFDENGSFILTSTCKLKPDAAPTVFNFSHYNVSSTDAPIGACTSKESSRGHRSKKRHSKLDSEEVYLLLINIVVW
jgi:hypothetical protein